MHSVMTRLTESNGMVPGRLLQYLIGMHDFYKVMMTSVIL